MDTDFLPLVSIDEVCKTKHDVLFFFFLIELFCRYLFYSSLTSHRSFRQCIIANLYGYETRVSWRLWNFLTVEICFIQGIFDTCFNAGILVFRYCIIWTSLYRQICIINNNACVLFIQIDHQRKCTKKSSKRGRYTLALPKSVLFYPPLYLFIHHCKSIGLMFPGDDWCHRVSSRSESVVVLFCFSR